MGPVGPGSDAWAALLEELPPAPAPVPPFLPRLRAALPALEALRLRRDACVADVTAVADRMQRLRLKGKRSTDLLVEQARLQRSAEALHAQLLQACRQLLRLHQAAAHAALQCWLQGQLELHGQTVRAFRQHVIHSPAHTPSLARLREDTDAHLRAISQLNITGQ